MHHSQSQGMLQMQHYSRAPEGNVLRWTRELRFDRIPVAAASTRGRVALRLSSRGWLLCAALEALISASKIVAATLLTFPILSIDKTRGEATMRDARSSKQQGHSCHPQPRPPRSASSKLAEISIPLQFCPSWLKLQTSRTFRHRPNPHHATPYDSTHAMPLRKTSKQRGARFGRRG